MQRNQNFNNGTIIAMGVAIGSGIGVAIHNIGVGIGIGVAIAAAYIGGCALRRRRSAECCPPENRQRE